MTADKNWFTLIDDILIASETRKQRVIAITSLRKEAGVSTLAKGVSKASSLANYKSLLVDLSKSSRNNQAAGTDKQAWRPSLSLDPSPFIQKINDDYFELEVCSEENERFFFNNITRLRDIFKNKLGEFEKIILDLPPIHSNHELYVNPISCASACDAVYMICMRAKTLQRDLKTAAEKLEIENIRLEGVILNNHGYVTTGQDMARSLRKMGAFVPGLKRLAKFAENLELLN